jgi:hypothetical protein
LHRIDGFVISDPARERWPSCIPPSASTRHQWLREAKYLSERVHPHASFKMCFSVYPEDEACGRLLRPTERRQSAALAGGHEKSCLKVAAICSSAQST